jgi:hypothetical protein
LEHVYAEKVATVETKGLCMKDETTVTLNHTAKPDKQVTKYNHNGTIKNLKGYVFVLGGMAAMCC